MQCGGSYRNSQLSTPTRHCSHRERVVAPVVLVVLSVVAIAGSVVFTAVVIVIVMRVVMIVIVIRVVMMVIVVFVKVLEIKNVSEAKTIR